MLRKIVNFYYNFTFWLKYRKLSWYQEYFSSKHKGKIEK